MENKNLLAEVIKNRIEKSNNMNVDEKERNNAFKEAMEAVDRYIEMEKIESSTIEKEFDRENDLRKIEMQFDNQEKDYKKNTILKYVEVAAVPVALFIMDALMKRSYIKTVCNFEKDYTFTTTPGKGVGSIFRFKN